MDQQQITDAGDLRKYRIELPNIADDDLDPFQFRLYGHYKRVCGAGGGECRESVRTTATNCKMSAEKVISTRQWLADNGWISLNQDDKNIYHITITDRWPENFVRYSEQRVRNSERTVRNSEREPLDISNQRKNHIKKELEKKNSSSDHRLSSLPADQPQQPKRTRQTDPDYNRICTAFESDGFGMLTPILAGQVGTLLDSYPVDWIVDAMAIAVARNSRNLSYVNGILRNFSTEGRGQRSTGNPFADERNEPPAVTPPPQPQAASAPAADNGPLAEVWRAVVAVASPAAREWLAQTQLRSVADGCAVIAAPAKSAQYISSQLGNQIRRSMATAGHPVQRIEVMAASAAESEIVA